MNTTYLIQRLKKPIALSTAGETFKDSPFSFGGGYRNGGLSEEAMDLLRPIFRFDYMGSAEFEFGAVPKAFSKLTDGVSTGTVQLDSHTIYFVAPTSIELVTDRITEIYKNKFYLKEASYLKQSLEGKRHFEDIIGWFELDNGFIFFKDKETFEKFKNLFEE